MADPASMATSAVVQTANQKDKPYKYIGYPGFCDYLADDNDGLLFRRFGALNARVLLSLQHDIEVQEQHLMDLDRQCREDPSDFALMNSLKWDKHPQNPHAQRAAVVEKVQPRLHTYNEHLATYSVLRDRQPAQAYQVKNIKTWLQNRSNPKATNSGPIRDEEQQYLDTGTDLICVSSQYKPPISRLLEKSALIRWLCRKQPISSGTLDSKTEYYSDRRVEWLGNFLIVLLGLMMLYGPMWWLNYMVDDEKRLAVITVFVFLFAVALSSVGSGRPFETLAATAAYAAVLMVFLQRQVGGDART